MRTTTITTLAGVFTMPFAIAQAPDATPSAPPHADACAACHGTNGVSVAPGIPHLAAQDEAYLRAQLEAYRSGTRANPLMNALASQLDDEEISALTAHYAVLPGAPDGMARSELLQDLIAADFPFADDYETRFTRYRTTNPGMEVRHLYANQVALEAARDGRPLPDGSYLLVEIFSAQLGDDGQPLTDEDGRFIAGERVGFNAMARETGWGNAIPELLRNENWLYANFSADGTLNTSINQAACLACHVPLTEQSYTFTLAELAEASAR